MRARCAEVAQKSMMFASDPGAEWALPIYALAGSDERGVAGVGFDQLRYHLADRDLYLTWLFTRLQGMGHNVHPPPRPDAYPSPHGPADEYGPDIEAHVQRIRARLRDDPVAEYWRQTTRMTREDFEHSDGTTVRFPASCRLWDERPTMIQLLDQVLVLERGGWTRGIRVRTYGIPPYVSALGRSAVEAGVFGDRAVIDAPQWRLDHDRHTLAPGPPSGYWLRYRVRETGLPGSDSVGPVDPAHLTLDLDPLDAPGPAPHPVTAPAPAPQPPEDRPPAPVDAVADDEADEEFAQELKDWGLRPAPNAEPADPHERHRAAALSRLWELRDAELYGAGDSTPTRIAERIVGDSRYPKPPRPPKFRELASHECIDTGAHRRPVRWAPGCPDRQLVTGERREWLLQWLPEVVAPWATRKQHTVLDGFTANTTLAQVREFLAREGFHEVRDVHGNAGPPPQPGSAFGFHPTNPGSQGEDHPPAGPGDVDLVLVSSEGFLATLHACDLGDGPQPQHVRVSYNVAALDRELFAAGVSAYEYGTDEHERLTNIRYGTIHSQVHLPSGSLRVQLAALRAFATPLTPWTHPVHLHIGRDSTSRDHLRHVITELPDNVHTLLGPQLAQSA
jgi:hypothetical protein